MQWAVWSRLRAMLVAALPSLRVIGLVYAGLAGVAAPVLLISMSVTPGAPNLQQVTQPARDAVANVVQPTSDMVSSLVTSPGMPIVIRPATLPPQVSNPASFVDTATLDITIDEAPADGDVTDESAVPQSAPVIVRTRRSVAAPPPTIETAPIEDLTSDDTEVADAQMDVVDDTASQAEEAVVQPAEASEQQIAEAQAPQALPTPPTTAQEAKAQMDVANQAAIDAAKAAQAQAKAQADAANQAAIDAAKQAAIANAPAMADGDLSLPVATPSAKVDPKLAAAEAKAAANAANQAAIDAAKAAAKSKKTRSAKP